MRAAATGSTEPEGLRQLSGVAHHYGDVTEMVCFREATKTCADHFRDVTKLLLCGAHFVDLNEIDHFAVLGNMARNAGQLPQPFWLGATRGGGSHSLSASVARA